MIHIYIKTHNVTGLKYLGKTTRDPFKYRGSGTHWKRHLKKHGNNVSTRIVASFECPLECSAFSTKLSMDLNVVDSNEWANLIHENGLDGKPSGSKGHVFTDLELQKMSRILKLRWADEEFREKMSKVHRSRLCNFDRNVLSQRAKLSWTDERRSRHSVAMILINRDNENMNPFGGDFSKSESHKKAISKALMGLPKTEDHKKALAFAKILKYNPECTFKSYDDGVQKTKSLLAKGLRTSQIARELKIGYTAATKLVVISNEYLLKEK